MLVKRLVTMSRTLSTLQNVLMLVTCAKVLGHRAAAAPVRNGPCYRPLRRRSPLRGPGAAGAAERVLHPACALPVQPLLGPPTSLPQRPQWGSCRAAPRLPRPEEIGERLEIGRATDACSER